MVNINLIPAIEKLVEYVASGLGTVAGPMLTRWRASAEADALRIRAQGKADARLIETESHVSSLQLITAAQHEARKYLTTDQSLFRSEIRLKQEIESRIEFQEEKRQRNIGRVVQMAAEELRDKEVPNHEVDPDWTARFFSDVQDVTSEQIQIIWAKILAGEVETPGRTSLHTLAILRNMSQRDAEMFGNIARFVLSDFILRDVRYTGRVPGFPSDMNLLQFQTYGLIFAGEPNLVKEVDVIEGKAIQRYDRSTVFVISRIDGRSPSVISIPTHGLTLQGKELCHIIKPEVSKDYLHAFSQFLYDQGCMLACGHAEGTGPELDVTNLELIEPRMPK